MLSPASTAYIVALPRCNSVVTGLYHVNTLCRILPTSCGHDYVAGFTPQPQSDPRLSSAGVAVVYLNNSFLTGALGTHQAKAVGATLSCGSVGQSTLDAAQSPALYRVLVLRPIPNGRCSPEEMHYRVRFSI